MKGDEVDMGSHVADPLGGREADCGRIVIDLAPERIIRALTHQLYGRMRIYKGMQEC